MIIACRRRWWRRRSDLLPSDLLLLPVDPSEGAPAFALSLAALRACSITRELQAGKRIHKDEQEQIKSGEKKNIRIMNALINMYAKCGSMADAQQVFDAMAMALARPDLVSWTSLIQGYALNGMEDLALGLFQAMQEDAGIAPDDRAVVAALMACGRLKQLERGSAIHMKNNYYSQNNVFVASAVIDMYAKCENMASAQAAWDSMVVRPDVVCWTALIMGYVQNGEAEMALNLFARMQNQEEQAHVLLPTAPTYVAALTACATLASSSSSAAAATVHDEQKKKLVLLEKGIAIHSQAAKTGYCYCDVFVGSSLIDMYVKCGSLVDARTVFDRMMKRDVVVWTAMLMGYVEAGEFSLALDLFASMGSSSSSRCEPDPACLVCALLACAGLVAAEEEASSSSGPKLKLKSLQKSMELHSFAAERGFLDHTSVTNTLIHLYSKCGSLFDARLVFDNNFARQCHADVVSWNTLLLAYTDNGQAEVALELYASMKLMPVMRAADSATYIPVLAACGNLANLEAGKEIHGDICRSGSESDAFVANSLIRMYGKCGSNLNALVAFESAANSGMNINLVTWNALISCYSSQASYKRALELLSEMHEQGVRADGVTFLCVLAACAHAGAVDAGIECFKLMSLPQYGVAPGIEHHHCLISMLARANRLDDAVQMARSMAAAGQATAMTWTIVLDACCKSKNVAVAEEAFRQLVKLDPQQTSAYVLMMNMYVYDDAIKCKQMKLASRGENTS